MYGHNHSNSVSQNHKAQLANAYNELGKELSSPKIRVVGNYTLGKTIGEGTYGKVRLGIHRLTSTKVAIKQIPKDMSAALTREIHHHRRLHHPHVVQLYEVIATESYIWLVTELCSGGELFDYLVEKGRLGEAECKIIFGQICLAVGYIHDKGIVHRDLKLENVLLDERCRVKLSDFGFTRECERGMLLETFCGTTGYAAPEILESKKYLGPEVDIWSLGVILYTLLTGGLPFDDDDETIMREKIIIGTYEDAEFLSEDCRDLIHNILQKDPSNRFSIAQILAHKWFKKPSEEQAEAVTKVDVLPSPQPINEVEPVAIAGPMVINESVSSAPSELSFHSASSELCSTPPTTPEKVSEEVLANHPNMSESTLTKDFSDALEGVHEKATLKSDRPETVVEEEVLQTFSNNQQSSRDPSPQANGRRFSSNSIKSTNFPTRTPVRTKRRSVSSVISQPSSPTRDSSPAVPHEFSSLLSTPAPLLFSTPLERDLLNTLSGLGFDTGQMVHSVLSDACDASGAMWWILKRKTEKRALEEIGKGSADGQQQAADVDAEVTLDVNKPQPPTPVEYPIYSCQEQVVNMPPPPAAPELAFVPPTPVAATTQRPVTPPRSNSPREALSPSPTVGDSTTLKSNPSTPGGSLREKDKDSLRSKRYDGKPRSGSVSIMQRATTALEAAGLVRKKSTEAVKEEKERKDDKEERHAHRLTKSPPTRPVKDSTLPPATPEKELNSTLPASPWIVPSGVPPSLSLQTITASPGTTAANGPPLKLSSRNRSNLFSTFSKWFHDGRRKPPSPLQLSSPSTSPVMTHVSPVNNRNHRGTYKKRADGRFQRRAGKRHSASSKRSSSMNSRRSSVTSAQMALMESSVFTSDQMPNISRQRSDPSRRSFTPTSERGEHSSRPSSVRSMNLNNRHKKSPSASSIGSAVRNGRTTSPMTKYHRRNGSSSSTRVRHGKSADGLSRPYHVRSNSATSSVHSRHSSRPPSIYELSENEAPRTASPMLSARSRRSLDDTPRKGGFNTSMMHRKQHGIHASPSLSSYASLGRTSWKKAWGKEPPGWQSRSTRVPIEVLSISPDQSTNLRDVITGRQSLNMGDDDDWIDEDDDIAAFVGGLGQLTSSARSSIAIPEQPLLLSPPPRNKSNRNTKRAGKYSDTTPNISRPAGRSKPGHSPVLSTTSLPDTLSFETLTGSNDSRVGRRQLPTGRSGPAFRNAIQEEDEGEED